MATTPALMTIEQYLHTAYSPDVDFVNGDIQERNLGEKDHGRLQGLLFAWFLAREASFGFEAVTELRMLVAPDRVRICDVVVLDANAPDEQVTVTPPLICVEIMSPEDRLSRAIKVLEDYRAMGVPNIWLIDPQERLAYIFGPDGLRQQEDLVLRAQSPEIALDINTLFAELDRKKNRQTHD
jgi:Uma2 family endonuclease